MKEIIEKYKFCFDDIPIEYVIEKSNEIYNLILDLNPKITIQSDVVIQFTDDNICVEF